MATDHYRKADMLFDTIAEYDAEIADTRAELKKSMERQRYTSGGPGAGMHQERGDVASIRMYLDMLSKEREILKRREDAALHGTTHLVQFRRPR